MLTLSHSRTRAHAHAHAHAHARAHAHTHTRTRTHAHTHVHKFAAYLPAAVQTRYSLALQSKHHECNSVEVIEFSAFLRESNKHLDGLRALAAVRQPYDAATDPIAHSIETRNESFDVWRAPCSVCVCEIMHTTKRAHTASQSAKKKNVTRKTLKDMRVISCVCVRTHVFVLVHDCACACLCLCMFVHHRSVSKTKNKNK